MLFRHENVSAKKTSPINTSTKCVYRKNVIFTIKLNWIESSNSLFRLNVSNVGFYYFHDGIFRYSISREQNTICASQRAQWKIEKLFFLSLRLFYRFFQRARCAPSISTFGCCFCCYSIFIGIYLPVCAEIEGILRASMVGSYLPKYVHRKGEFSLNTAYMYSTLMIHKGSIVKVRCCRFRCHCWALFFCHFNIN